METILIIIVLYLIYKFFEHTSEQTRINSLKHSKFNNDGSITYNVIYLFGHRGTDHYLEKYVKAKTTQGELTLYEDYLEFISHEFPTTQKFRIKYEHITNIRIDPPKLWIDKGKNNTIGYISKEANDLQFKINRQVSQFIEKEKKNIQFEEAQIKSRNLDEISPQRFEKLVVEIFKAMGYLVTHSGKSGDEGIDITCKKLSGEKVIVQCKRYKGKVSSTAVRNFYGALTHTRAQMGYIVTTGDFTKPAKEWVKGKPIELVGRNALALWLDKYLPKPTRNQNFLTNDESKPIFSSTPLISKSYKSRKPRKTQPRLRPLKICNKPLDNGCGNYIPVEDKFCKYCGVESENRSWFCDNCERYFSAENLFCPRCGEQYIFKDINDRARCPKCYKFFFWRR